MNPLRRTRPYLQAVALVSAMAAPSCLEPTQITLLLRTDVPCDRFGSATVTVATPDALETTPSKAELTSCTPRLGTLVVIPSSSRTEDVAVKVVLGVGKPASACAAPDYSGCIVARFKLSFVEHQPLMLPVDLRGACVGVPCGATETCVLGECRPYSVPNPGACVTEDACSDLSLRCKNAPTTEACNLADDDCNGKCDDLDGCRVGIYESIGHGDLGYVGLYTKDATTASSGGYTIKTKNFFYVYTAPQPGTVPLYRCGTKNGTYIDRGPCSPILETLGWVATTPRCGSVPIYRANLGWDHILTFDPSTNGKLPGIYWHDEGIYVYVWLAPRG